MDVSIIYVNYKTASLVIDSIGSIRQLTEGITYEIIVVDNASGDGSLEKIQEAYPDIIGLRSTENLGFGRGNNLGLKYAKGRNILFLNPDTRLINNAIAMMCSFLDTTHQAAACGGNLFDEQGNATSSFGRKYPSYGWEFLSIAYITPISFPYPKSSYFNYSPNILQVATIVGADLMVKKIALEECGAFDDRFFMNYEETELCRRLSKAGYKIYSFPQAKITHLEGRSTYIKQSRLYCLYQGQYIYFHKLHGKWGCRLIYMITQLKNYLRMVQFTLLKNPTRFSYWKMKKDTNCTVWKSAKIKSLRS